jgi:hypothetical protein
MENEKDILDTEIEEDIIDVEIEEEPEEMPEEIPEDTPESEEEKGGFDIDNLKYDENGDIIIPDDTAEESSSEDVEEEKHEESDSEPAKDSRDERIKDLERKLADLEAQSLDTLKKLGVDSTDAMDGLATLAAETDNVSKEEYIRKRDEARQKAIEDAISETAKNEKVYADDLAELQANYSTAKGYKHIKDMPKEIYDKFAHYRYLGLPAKDAYAAANPDGIRNDVASATKRQTDSKAHLQSSVPKGSNKTAVKMTRSEINEWRGIFPGKSDKEIVALFRKTKTNR